MAFITLWRDGELTCELVIGLDPERPYSLRIVTRASILREEAMATADQAARVSARWHEEHEGIRFASDYGRSTKCPVTNASIS